jgi:uncharacterized protein YrrD
MRLTYRELIGLPIRDRHAKGLLGRVTDLVINSDDGKVLALFVGSGKKLIVPTVDVVRMTREELFVEGHEALATPADIVRIDEVIQLGVPLLKNRVFTLSRQFLGSVIELEIETNGWVVAKLEVAKLVLNIPTQKKLIDASDIIRITKSEITVQDALVKETVTKKAKAAEIEAIPAQAISDLNFQ